MVCQKSYFCPVHLRMQHLRPPGAAEQSTAEAGMPQYTMRKAASGKAPAISHNDRRSPTTQAEYMAKKVVKSRLEAKMLSKLKYCHRNSQRAGHRQQQGIRYLRLALNAS